MGLAKKDSFILLYKANLCLTYSRANISDTKQILFYDKACYKNLVYLMICIYRQQADDTCVSVASQVISFHWITYCGLLMPYHEFKLHQFVHWLCI